MMTAVDTLRVLIHGFYGEDRMTVVRAELGKSGIELVQRAVTTPAELIEAARDVDALYEMRLPITGEIMRQLPRLKAVCAGGIGVDRFDVDAATELGIVVINLPRVFHREVA